MVPVPNIFDIYKIGKSINLKKRKQAYGAKTEIIKTITCNNRHQMDQLERILIEKFNSEFNRHSYGSEWFVGDCQLMIETMNNFQNNHFNNYIDDIHFNTNI